MERGEHYMKTYTIFLIDPLDKDFVPIKVDWFDKYPDNFYTEEYPNRYIGFEIEEILNKYNKFSELLLKSNISNSCLNEKSKIKKNFFLIFFL